MKKTLVLIVLLSAFLFGCLEGGQQAQPTTQPTIDELVSITQPQSLTASITDGAIEPDDLQIPVGTVVVFVNNGEVAHNIAFEDEESPVLAPGESFSKLFDEAGEYSYGCTIHHGLEMGVITVS